MIRKRIVTMILMFAFTITLTSECFITNCPVGGKRSSGDTKLTASRRCSACGPKSLGRCYGPQICCGSEFGCHINTRDSLICKLENIYPVPCENKADSCGDTFEGKCAADGVCCSTDECILEESCKRRGGGSLDTLSGGTLGGHGGFLLKEEMPLSSSIE